MFASGAAPAARADTPPVEEDYTLHCSACHGPAGAGVPGRVPSLFETGELALRSGGRDYLMRVPGAAQSPLDDARLARLLEWVVERFGGVVVAPPFGAVEVGAARRAPLRDPAPVRAKVMARE
jgi:mono/diheme cytochrome c family protein